MEIFLSHELRSMAELCEEVEAVHGEDATHEHVDALVRTARPNRSTATARARRATR